jgi:hypothetical protein
MSTIMAPIGTELGTAVAALFVAGVGVSGGSLLVAAGIVVGFTAAFDPVGGEIGKGAGAAHASGVQQTPETVQSTTEGFLMSLGVPASFL